VVNRIGIDHVGLSSDFYNYSFSLDGWRDASETRNVTLELVRRGYTVEEIGKIWSGNTLRVWREAEEVAAQLQRQMGRESQVCSGTVPVRFSQPRQAGCTPLCGFLCRTPPGVSSFM